MSRPHQILLSKYVLLILCELCLNYKPQLNYISTRTRTIKNEVQRIMLNSNKEKQTKLHFLYFLTWETSMSVTPVYACPIYVCPIYVCSGCSFIYAPFIHLLHTDIFHVCWWKCSTRVAEHPHPFRGGLLKPSSSQSCLEARAKQSGFS